MMTPKGIPPPIGRQNSRKTPSAPLGQPLGKGAVGSSRARSNSSGEIGIAHGVCQLGAAVQQLFAEVDREGIARGVPALGAKEDRTRPDRATVQLQVEVEALCVA